MKKLLSIASLFFMAVLFCFPVRVMASTSDTLIVYGSDSRSLDVIINADTTSSGTQAHKAYKLVSRDTTYIYTGAVSTKSDLTIIGVLGSDGRPPCIQPTILSDGSVPTELFVLKGKGAKVVFKNLYLMGLSTNNTLYEMANAIHMLSDNMRLTVDNVIFEQYWGNDILYAGDWNSFFITNCKFRNGNQPSWYSAEVLRNETNNSYVDSLVMKCNTILCITAYAACPVTKKMVNYFEFSHNSILWMFKNPFWIFNVTNAKVNDNIFYATSAGGQSLTEYQWWDELWSLDISSTIDLDTLDIAKAKEFCPTDSAKPDVRWIAEAKRNIEVKNNVYFTPEVLVNNVKAWNDTAHVDSIYTSPWMNNRTKGMFADKAHWPGLVESGNVNMDPGFGAGILNIFYENTGNGSGFWKYFTDIRTGSSTSAAYGYQLQSVNPDIYWTPQWPLPEVADMQYTNTALRTASTDGKPVGDPGWFTGGYTGVNDNKTQIVNKFQLFEAYPNPFNPSTNIKFSVAQAGNVSLKIYNIMGQMVKSVVSNEYKEKGEYTLNVNMSNLSSGVYFYTLSQGKMNVTKKLVLMK